MRDMIKRELARIKRGERSWITMPKRRNRIKVEAKRTAENISSPAKTNVNDGQACHRWTVVKYRCSKCGRESTIDRIVEGKEGLCPGSLDPDDVRSTISSEATAIAEAACTRIAIERAPEVRICQTCLYGDDEGRCWKYPRDQAMLCRENGRILWRGEP